MSETDKTQNFERLRGESKRWQERALLAESALENQPTEEVDTTELDQMRTRAEAAELAAHRGVLLEAGFGPDSGESKALLRDLASGDVEADPAAVVTRASEEYGWSPNLVLYSKAEAVQIASAQQMAALRTATVSDEPPNLDNQVAEARNAGDHELALRMQTRQAAERMLKG